MILDDELLGALQDLVESPGWAWLARRLQERKSRHLIALTQDSSTADLAAVRGLQAAIAEIDVLLRLPTQEIRRLQSRALAGAPAVPGAKEEST